jgi:hypothetical protein
MGRTLAVVRQAKEESRALVHLGFRPDASAMLLDNALNGCETHSRSLELLGMVKALENAE